MDELALGSAPLAERHLDRLESEGVRSILSLCRDDEAPLLSGQCGRFRCERVVMPDHRMGRAPEFAELTAALDQLEALRTLGPVFMHCVAAMERSPLVCMAWLVWRHGQRPLQALDYLMQVHPGTNPLPGQLALLSQLHSGNGVGTHREQRPTATPGAPG